ncbi:MAG: hypothetical protein IPJ20_23960 [Flammeovirgaceae bacterium]|nr:hypothetical protein [Flammeovirgaceae bacterium]
MIVKDKSQPRPLIFEAGMFILSYRDFSVIFSPVPPGWSRTVTVMRTVVPCGTVLAAVYIQRPLLSGVSSASRFRYLPVGVAHDHGQAGHLEIIVGAYHDWVSHRAAVLR